MAARRNTGRTAEIILAWQRQRGKSYPLRHTQRVSDNRVLHITLVSRRRSNPFTQDFLQVSQSIGVDNGEASQVARGLPNLAQRRHSDNAINGKVWDPVPLPQLR